MLRGWLQKRRHDTSVARIETHLQDMSLAEVSEHVENLTARSERVAEEVKKRQGRDIWGQTVTDIARHA